MIMEEEKVLWKPLGLKLISFKKLEDGEIVGTGFLNPVLDRFSLFTMLYFQAKFYKQYSDLAQWNGKMVSNTFAPPVGSRPQFRALKALVKSHIFRVSFPLVMTFAVTYKCQCRCPHCSAANHVRSDIEELSTEEAKRLIDESLDLGISVIAFTGGEPLVRKDIFELISYVDKRKAICHLFTNGLLLNDAYVQKLADAGLYSLFLSLDSPYPEEHNRMRGVPGLFEKGVEGLQKLKSKGIFVALSSYATRSGTVKGMYKKMYEFAQKIGVQNLVLFDNVPTGALMRDTSEMLTKDQREEIIDYTTNIFNQRMKPTLSSQAWQNSIEGYLGGIGCVAGCIQYYVSAYGEVTPCDFTPLSFGSIREESLKKIWKRMRSHPAYKHRRQFCRMQNPKFRHAYIDPIPEDAILPFSVDKLPRVDFRKDFKKTPVAAS
jgi:MoaA/NifB/PqqE/SkfB family radical SAM enzyme